MQESAKTFILGLGHQKCGTSWVYNYLAQSAHFCKGVEKEYHIWDALDIPLLKRNLVQKESIKTDSIRSIRYDMQNNRSAYFNYFSSLYSKEHSIAADITPSYCGLKAPRLNEIKTNFSKIGIKVKALILIRDPLSRIKSAVRFNLDRKNYSEGIGSANLDFSSAIKAYYKSEHCALRTNYQSIIFEAKKVFLEEDLYIGIYESMFTRGEMQRLSSFLGVDLFMEYSDVKVNKTSGLAEITNADSMIESYYADVYDFCFKNYSITQELWRMHPHS